MQQITTGSSNQPKTGDGPPPCMDQEDIDDLTLEEAKDLIWKEKRAILNLKAKKFQSSRDENMLKAREDLRDRLDAQIEKLKNEPPPSKEFLQEMDRQERVLLKFQKNNESSELFKSYSSRKLEKPVESNLYCDSANFRAKLEAK